MSKLRKWLLIPVCGIVALALMWTFLRGGEPRYEGRSLSQWLTQYRTNSADAPQGRAAQQAVLSIGTNAIPYLLQRIAYNRPQWRTKVARATPDGLSWATDWLLADGDRKVDAILGFEILGTNAAPAIPRLTALMNSTNAYLSSKSAIYALCAIGDPALPALAAALKDPATPHRENIASAIAIRPPRNITTNLWLPPLIAALNDSDLWVRWSTTNALREIAPQVLTNAPPQ